MKINIFKLTPPKKIPVENDIRLKVDKLDIETNTKILKFEPPERLSEPL